MLAQCCSNIEYRNQNIVQMVDLQINIKGANIGTILLSIENFTIQILTNTHSMFKRRLVQCLILFKQHWEDVGPITKLTS